ncbi:hypothetical protein HNS38_19615 [Lentimicrobium sp. L6]|uniref:hypothetical protein n=1 Tax=Lentimicrobium sp. L6 TaxID=2735916 RepID=UPI001553E098|nr:hypothetical protein [Lentimicrobium sp. L6]NPD86970.1 hypothetical protein [Lentimicrobium sp. L6]
MAQHESAYPDREYTSLNEEDYRNYNIVVGTLKKIEESDLKLRNACNKIIHADSLHIDFPIQDTHPLDNGKNGYGDNELSSFRNPMIITKGEYQGNEWTAEISVIKFIDGIINFPI